MIGWGIPPSAPSNRLTPLLIHPSSPTPSNMAPKPKSSGNKDRIAYSEFGNHDNPDALKRAVPDLPPNQQNLRVETSRSGRKGKTVTIIRGFQAKPETLTDLLKKLKTLCGAGGTVKENEIEVQGDHKQKIVQFLVQLGYRAKASGG